MDSKQSTNRISSEINQWKAREERLSKLFSFSVSDNKAFLKDKLRFYERVVPDIRIQIYLMSVWHCAYYDRNATILKKNSIPMYWGGCLESYLLFL